MKVNIGPYCKYPNISGAENLYCKIKYLKEHWDVEIREGDWMDKAVGFILDKIQAFNVLMYNKVNRYVKIEIEPFDTWNADHTLALVIHPVLVQLRDTNHGYAVVDKADLPDNLCSLEHCEEQWLWVMDEMIWAFDRIKDDDYILMSKENQERIRNGLRLFGKYYMALWD